MTPIILSDPEESKVTYRDHRDTVCVELITASKTDIPKERSVLSKVWPFKFLVSSLISPASIGLGNAAITLKTIVPQKAMLPKFILRLNWSHLEDHFQRHSYLCISLSPFLSIHTYMKVQTGRLFISHYFRQKCWHSKIQLLRQSGDHCMDGFLKWMRADSKQGTHVYVGVRCDEDSPY